MMFTDEAERQRAREAAMAVAACGWPTEQTQADCRQDAAAWFDKLYPPVPYTPSPVFEAALDDAIELARSHERALTYRSLDHCLDRYQEFESARARVEAMYAERLGEAGEVRCVAVTNYLVDDVTIALPMGHFKALDRVRVTRYEEKRK